MDPKAPTSNSWRSFLIRIHVIFFVFYNVGTLSIIKGTIPAIFVIKTPRYDSCSLLPTKLILMTIKWVSLSILMTIKWVSWSILMTIKWVSWSILMTIKWVSLSIFPWTQSNLNLEIKRNLNFNDSLKQAIFEIFEVRTNCARLERILPPFLFLKHLEEIEPSFITISKLSNNEIRETFCGEELKLMCKLFEMNTQQDFLDIL